MNKIVSKTPEKVAPKKVYKISIRFGSSGGTSMIIRNDLPSLIDNTEKSVAWLKANDFKEADIEIIGNKPECWETYYPAPVVEPTPLVEKVSEVLAGTPTQAPADTMAVTTANLDSGTIVQEQVKDVFEGIPVAPVAEVPPEVVS